MNNVYFACRACKAYVDAGYRWCYWHLEEPGIVVPGQTISLKAVLEAEEYWQPGEDACSAWLRRLLPEIGLFLRQHGGHDVLYGEDDQFIDYEQDDYLDWINVAGFVVDLLPRYFAERLGHKTWADVREYISKLDRPPWWYDHPVAGAKAQAAFERSAQKIQAMNRYKTVSPWTDT